MTVFFDYNGLAIPFGGQTVETFPKNSFMITEICSVENTLRCLDFGLQVKCNENDNE